MFCRYLLKEINDFHCSGGIYLRKSTNSLRKSIIPEGTTMEMGGIDNIVEAKQWYLSVAQHIAMGVSMTKKGLNPKVIISW